MDIPNYKIEGVIGEGNMATVYLARHELLNRQVALKCMKEVLTDTPGFAERFLYEGQVIAGLQHPNILTIYDLGICKASKTPFLAMEYIQNGDLRDRIKDGINEPDALAIIAHLADGLDYAHSKGIIHRDIKPGNILFRDDGTPLIADFGIAKSTEVDQGLTSTGLVVGTPFYMSPEQARDLPLDGRSDLYSLGIILYEMLTGKVPYEGASVIGTALQHVQSPVPKFDQELAHLQPLLDRLLAKEPCDRFSCGASLASTIDKYNQGHEISDNPGDSVTFPKIKLSFFQRYKLFDLILFSLILTIALLIIYPKQSTEPTPQ